MKIQEGYVESSEVFYLIPNPNLKLSDIQGEIGNVEIAKTLDDFIIDGSLFGKWVPINQMVDVDEISDLNVYRGFHSFKVYKWPYDDRCHAG